MALRDNRGRPSSEVASGGGTDLLDEIPVPNFSFESPTLSPWEIVGQPLSVTFGFTGVGGADGGACARIVGRSLAGAVDGIQLPPVLPVVPGEQYVLSAWVWKAGGETALTVVLPTEQGLSSQTVLGVGDGVWTEITTSFIPARARLCGVRIAPAHQNGVQPTGEWMVDNVTLTRVATPRSAPSRLYFHTATDAPAVWDPFPTGSTRVPWLGEPLAVWFMPFRSSHRYVRLCANVASSTEDLDALLEVTYTSTISVANPSVTTTGSTQLSPSFTTARPRLVVGVRPGLRLSRFTTIDSLIPAFSTTNAQADVSPEAGDRYLRLYGFGGSGGRVEFGSVWLEVL